MITVISLVRICHYTKILYRYWLYSPHCVFHSFDSCNWKFTKVYLLSVRNSRELPRAKAGSRSHTVLGATRPGTRPHTARGAGFAMRPQGRGSSTIYRGSSRWVRLRQTIVWRCSGQQAGEGSALWSLLFGAPWEGLGGHLSPKAGKLLGDAHIGSLLTAAGVPWSVMHHEALGRHLGLLMVGGGNHLHLFISYPNPLTLWQPPVCSPYL